MTDLYRIELEDFRAYRSTFLDSTEGQKVLADLIDVYLYNQVVMPQSDVDAEGLDRARDVIRYIIGKLGLGEDSATFVKGLALANVKGPQPMDQKTAEE